MEGTNKIGPKLWIGEMLVLQPVNRRVSVCLLLNSLTIILLEPSSSFVQGQGLSSFDFRTLNNSTEKLLTRGDAVYDSSSVWLNRAYAGSDGGANYSCGGVVYPDSIQMRDSSGSGSPAVASFNTSFTFSMTGANSAGMAFTFLVENHPNGSAGACLCLLEKWQNGNLNNQLFAVEFDTWQNPEFNDSSNNHVGVNVNSMDSVSFYNLCGDGIKDCSYLVTGGDFTSWIDYDSATQTLDVFLTNGSLILGTVAKPADPLIQVSNLNLSNVLNDYMFVGITGSAGMYREVKNIKSWSFRTGSFGPRQGSKSKSSRGGLIAGSVAAASGVLIAAVLCILYILLCRRAGGAEEPLSSRLSSSPNMADNHKLWSSSVDSPPAPSKREGSLPLHIFISHTGGPNGAQKNFAISLSAALESSAARLQYNYVVFIDRQMKKGTLFPPELLQQIESTDVALVVVTEEYFQSWWPMWELVKFVELYMKNTQAPKVRVLPLFYKLTTRQVRSFLSEQGLEEQWRGMSTESHPIDVQEYRRAVETLCILNGIEYNFKDYSHDAEYIEVILREVRKIYVEVTSIQNLRRRKSKRWDREAV
jgi:hypothetical protein